MYTEIGILSIDTISIEGQENNLNKIKVSKGSGLYTFPIPWDKRLGAKGLMQYQEPITFTTEEPVHIWGMQSTSTDRIYTLDFSPESLSKIEQAIIFTLRFED
ncbi:hypothetical protein [Paenibacillus dakarensis]|uniref:hypothetical protein n=1 Tax=Paenibacillus dakarensis TaxID=1527293 RepID=UPI0006D540C9|nr:hypothetical protein [Paenibacillus dakarensis]